MTRRIKKSRLCLSPKPNQRKRNSKMEVVNATSYFTEIDMKPSNVTPEMFIEWRKKLGMSQSSAARRLGLSHSSIFSYESGKRKEGDVKIPILVCLGMSALSAGLSPYGEKND